MDHLSAERLSALASDPAAVPTEAEAGHLAGCRACRDDLAELSAVARGIRDVGPATLRPPHPDVWAAVTREVGSPRRPRRWLPVAAAAAAGLVVGVGATLGVVSARGGSADVVARTELAALPGEAGEGTAELVRRHDTMQLQVHAALEPLPGTAYHEVWLINGDGRRMYALGALPASGDASFWLPATLTPQLDGYATVDISLQPGDGNTAHSRHSLVRGTLPG